MKIAVSSYSFSQYMRDGRIDYFGAMDKAKEFGFDGIEIVGDKKAVGDIAAALKAKSAEICLPIVCYLTSADFLNNDLDAEVERVKGEVDVAAALGAKLMRHDSTWGIPKDFMPPTFDGILPRIAEGCRRVAEYAQTKCVRTMVENHGLLVQDSMRVEKLYNTVNHPNFSLLCDMGNFNCADENSALAVGRVAKIAAHAHAKDFHIKSGNGVNPGEGWFCSRGGNFLRGAIIGNGDVPVLQCMRVLKANGYDGWLALEFEGMEDCMTGIRIGLANLRRMVEEI